MKYFLLLLTIWSWASPSESEDAYAWTKHKLIAHAAGGIKGKDYTNSEEAFRNSYNNGYKLIEIDLSLTSDGELVARHGWDETYGQKFKPDAKALPYRKFIKLPYYLHYTPLDFERVIKLMKQHPEIYVLLDGKGGSAEDTKKLYEKVGEAIQDVDKDVLNRLIPQMYYREDLKLLRKHGFHDILYLAGREEYSAKSVIEFCKKNDLRTVGISKARVNEAFVTELFRQGIVTYIYTINDLDEMYTFFEIDVHGFYTDYIIPEEINDWERQEEKPRS
ncbi:phosphatidylinositol-specific phospholipase C/glycerophosphodiester phosphodiesterase family protein [Jeotgalibacillus proteolyticus]|uniref:phosphatidylinositol-specific phospholipase C/glycerophosphodiester phosphodiesterase family protein n=1 Tax=Jeotgalibacillus proteolyticus TaxID=2082395 RepID=UPI00143042F3|nr:phosphatidylinositol-specific phospholipase C/glycerophosphodiester phosphodiesterase family protein [Jeotgalibacillus proteolyticus]